MLNSRARQTSNASAPLAQVSSDPFSTIGAGANHVTAAATSAGSEVPAPSVQAPAEVPPADAHKQKWLEAYVLKEAEKDRKATQKAEEREKQKGRAPH